MNARQTLTRGQARERGLRTFRTGKPCKHGHLAERYVSSSNCQECERDRYRAKAKNVSLVSPEIMTRNEAKLRGMDMFYSGKKCQRLHTSPRYVSNNWCVSCALLAYGKGKSS